MIHIILIYIIIIFKTRKLFKNNYFYKKYFYFKLGTLFIFFIYIVSQSLNIVVKTEIKPFCAC